MKKNDWIDQVLRSTEGMKRAEAPPDLQEQIADVLFAPKIRKLSPAWALTVAASFALLLAANVLFLVKNHRQTPQTADNIGVTMQLLGDNQIYK